MSSLSLSKLFNAEQLVRDASFKQTQFANTPFAESFVYATGEPYLTQAIENDNVSCILTTPALAHKVKNKGLVVAEDAERLFYETHNRLFTTEQMHPEMPFGIDATVNIHHTAVIADNVWIGKNVTISANAVIEPYSYISDDVFIGPGAIIGATGHYYKRYQDGLFNVLHAGGVRLARGTQVLAGAIVSKTVHTDFTEIGEETIVSVHAHVGHGCKVGERCTITGNAQLAGFSNIGDDVWVGPSATVGNLRNIASGARIEIASVVVQDIAHGARVSGHFAVPHHINLRDHARRSKGD